MSGLTKLFILVISLTFFFSCSLLRRNGGAPEGDDSPSDSPRDQTVPKAQYEQLLSKYEVLQKRLENQTLTKNPDDVAPNSDEALVNKIKETDGGSNTVEMFKEGEHAGTPINNHPQVMVKEVSLDSSDDKVETQITELRSALKLLNENKFPEGLKAFQALGHSKNLQIKVRADFYLAEMFFIQNEFDLAMQLYESIVTQYSFTGLTLSSLEKLIICAEKLNQKSKAEKYKGIYRDTFGMS